MGLQFRVAQADNIGKARPHHGPAALARLALLLARHPGRVRVAKNDNAYRDPVKRRSALWRIRKEMRSARRGTRLFAKTENGVRFAVVAVEPVVLKGVIDTRENVALTARLEAEIQKLRNSRDYKKPLQEPSCAADTPPGLVSRKFRYRSNRTVEVRCHAKVMVALMRAMLKAPGIEVTVSSESMYSGSYRTYAQQNTLYQMYLNGTGHRAADPCYGYHRQGRALDILAASDKEKDALLSVRADGKKFYNGASFGDPPHYSFGALG